MSGRRVWLAPLFALLAAAIVPVVLLQSGPHVPKSAAPDPAPRLAAPSTPPLGAAYARPLFASSPMAGETLADAPELAGIVGRIDQDAVALVRATDGTTRTLRPGESVDGWRLHSLAIDAAFFVRGTQRARVPLPAGDAEPEAQ